MPIEQSKCCGAMYQVFTEPGVYRCFQCGKDCEITPASPKSAEWDDAWHEKLRTIWYEAVLDKKTGKANLHYELMEKYSTQFISQLLLQQEQKFVEEKRAIFDAMPDYDENIRDKVEQLRKQFLP